MCQIIRGKELAKHVGIHIKSTRLEGIYPRDIAQKHLGRNGIEIARKHNAKLKDIRIGHILFIPTILVLIMSMLVRRTHFSFHADIYSNAGAPVYFHPSPLENGIPSAPWGYFSHDPNPTSHGKDSLMERDRGALDDWYDVYRSTLTDVKAVV